MKVSYNWLQEYFDKPLPNPKDLADLLNIRAFEVEEIEERDGDSVLEIKITPDRAPDCLSHLGVAREVAVHAKMSLEKKTIKEIAGQFESAYNVVVEEHACRRYMAREVRDVVVGESPLELKLKLEAIGQRSINTIVDITNIVMYEIGQPMHAFDADKISGKTIAVGAPKVMKITTLDGKEVDLTSEDLTIQDESDNLAIAGVKGGNKAEVNSGTRNIILESANFFQVKVRKASKRTGIQTDSTKRFENGLTPKLAEKAIRLASQYIRKYASGNATQFSNIVDVYPRPASPYYTGVSLDEINAKLGIVLTVDEVSDIFNRLGFEFEYVNTKKFVVDMIRTLLGKPHNIFPSLTYDAPHSFDCTTLTAYVYAHGGLSIPRLTIDQLFYGTEITRDELEPGDLVFSHQDYGPVRTETVSFLPGTQFPDGVDHAGMYMGDDMIIHTSRSIGQVSEEKLSAAKNFQLQVKYRRFVSAEDMRFAVRVPEERLDIKGAVDLIEEVGRVYGYEHITPIAPELGAQSAEPSTYDKIATLKSCLVDLGFDEVVTYSFQKKGDVAVSKPLAKDKGYMRTDLAKGLTDALDLNFRNRELFAEEIVKIFEVGHVFVGDGEKTVLGVAARSASKKLKSRAVLEEALATLSEKTGVRFEISIADNQEVAEIDLENILSQLTKINNALDVLPGHSYKPFSPYPFMTRDLAVWASAAKTKTDVEKVITDHAGELLVRYDLFDEFSKDGKTSYAYRLVFQSNERTLTDEEVNPIMDKIYGTLQADSNFEIR